jgi:hypothetical protein
MPRTAFIPEQHGFQFPNSSTNQVATLPGGLQIETHGRCGGMAYAALDYYFAGLLVPSDTAVPAEDHWLADYIYARLLDSFFNTSAIHFVTWTMQADHATWFDKGLTAMTKQDEIPRLRQFIDAGRPVVLGLVGARDIANIGARNHQVVAYGYDADAAAQAIQIYVYDSSSPNQQIVLSTDANSPHVAASNHSEPWRGLFVHEYAFRSPPVPGTALWSAQASGQLLTPDGDQIDYAIERGVVSQDVVEFVLTLGPGVSPKKALNLPDGEGSSWDIAAEGAGASGSSGLWASQVRNGQSLTFKKAKPHGAIWEVYKLGHLGGLTPGTRVTFCWAKD